MKDEDKNKELAKFLKTEYVPLKTLTDIELNKNYCKCKKCGKIVTADTSIALTSDPPKYSYYCPFCDNDDFVYDNELYYNGEIEQLDRNLTRDNDTVGVVYCMICEESIPLTRSEWEGNHLIICEKCKKAVLKLRKMLDEE